MSEPVVVASVTITRVLYEGDMVDQVVTAAADGTDLGLAEALGMLTLAQHTLVESYAEAGL